MRSNRQLTACARTSRSEITCGRRGFLKFAGIATAASVGWVCSGAQPAHAAALTKVQRDKLSPADVIGMMKAGNERFRLGHESPHDYLAQQRASAKGQYRAAAGL